MTLPPSRMTVPFTTFPDTENHGLHHLRSSAAALCLDVALTSNVFPLEISRTSIGAFSGCSLPFRELFVLKTLASSHVSFPDPGIAKALLPYVTFSLPTENLTRVQFLAGDKSFPQDLTKPVEILTYG